LAEQQLRRALTISQGDFSVLATHPISLAFLLAAVAIIILPYLMRRFLRVTAIQ